MPHRRWTDDELRVAIASSVTMAQVLRALGLRARSYASLRPHIERLELDVSHIRTVAGARSGRPRSWSDDELRVAVAESQSLAATMRRLGYAPSGGIHRWLRAYIRDLGIDTSHFTGQAWAKGRSAPTTARPLDEILVENSTYNTARLRARLIKAGLKPAACELCGLQAWRGEPLPLMLDHINGEPTDNRLENLRILCPNCHALTPTWCARNRKPA